MDRVIDNASGSGVATGAGSFNFANNRLGLWLMWINYIIYQYNIK